MAQYSIKDVETLSGVKAHTLRVWELRYNFLKPKRTATNIRYYNDEQLRSILNISVLNKHGWRISRIAGLSPAELSKQMLNLTQAGETVDQLTDQLIHAMVDFKEDLFEKAVQQAILKHGIRNAFTAVIFPFMVRTGSLWAAGAICPSQEHFVSNLLRRKLSVAIDGCVLQRDIHTRRYALFVPEHDTHELLLMFTDYLLRKANHEVAYIGSSTPLSDAPRILKHFRPDVIVVYCTTPFPKQTVSSFIKDLLAAFPAIQILLGGPQFEGCRGKLPSRVQIVRSIADLNATIA